MRIGVLGINHKIADLNLRELLARACQKRFSPDSSTHGDNSFILLSTCNRTEIYFCSEDLALTHTYIIEVLRHEVGFEFDQKLYSFFGFDCFLHLCRVTSGLDSAIIAETEIQGQVKKAYELANQFVHLPHDLHYLFQKSLKIGKTSRTDYLASCNLPEIEQAIFNTAKLFFKNSLAPKILFVGFSEINLKIMRYLKTKDLKDITFCNRSQSKLETENETFKILPWNQLNSWVDYDLVIFGTKAPFSLAKASDFKEVNSKKLVIDLSVPRNVDPKVAKKNMVTLLNIDHINRLLNFRKIKLKNKILKAENLVFEATKQHIIAFKKKQSLRKELFALNA